MARITIEDCIRRVPNRFNLVQMAAIRTKQLKKGARPLVDSEENKEVVVSLREIAAGYVKPNYPEASPGVAAWPRWASSQRSCSQRADSFRHPSYATGPNTSPSSRSGTDT